ncbi:pantoate--beta-alanine ligase [Coxiella endosymbiont of Amblyomma nuttalli]|uniref:pantoate--beta-alanine ligase n=1 Tax=Coxiella endosymbiont of Amblyomma nuttalli TaxID=2749996 RepID=UPI001BA93229|nr:pantoate--beta-alanine ligase [Coxiella endosymbiont of Amblyomma nuttalli]QTS84012.1 Pantothenate synthetase [Coxiella endosymbiont of Amblyomma nuttalli]
MTKVINSLAEWQIIRKKLEKTIGFVPTMGNLHIGHASLLQRSKQENTITVLSLFVNPTQFNDNNDFKNYPRSLDRDITMANNYGIDYVLTPTYEALYPDRYAYRIINTIHQSQEATFRIGHFDGVLTIVMKLLILIKPTHAYFGEKDYQQLQLVEGLVKAFFLNTKIVPCKTIRNEFGLPLSSRNHRLTPKEFQLAKYFSENFHSHASCDEIKEALLRRGIEVEYIEDCDDRRFAAVRIGNIRLIDNFVLLKRCC